jgi:hypothetical protein
LRQTVCSTILKNEWNVVRSASLHKGGTSKKRLSPHLHKLPTRSNKVSPRTFQTALVQVQADREYVHHTQKMNFCGTFLCCQTSCFHGHVHTIRDFTVS